MFLILITEAINKTLLTSFWIYMPLQTLSTYIFHHALHRCVTGCYNFTPSFKCGFKRVFLALATASIMLVEVGDNY